MGNPSANNGKLTVNMSKDTKFTSDNQPAKRNGRGKSDRTKILEAMTRLSKTEEGFFDLLVERAFNPDDAFAFRELLGRIAPLTKATSPKVEFDFTKDAEPHLQAAEVLDAAASGVIPPDIALIFINAVKAAVDIEMSTDLKDRIKRIEEALGIDIDA